MGAGSSSLGSKPLYDSDLSTKTIMNKILEYMLKEISVRDFYSLADPAQCKKYVLLLANNIYKEFYELGIAPTKDKQSVLLFRSVKDLVEVPESEKLNRQSLCVLLSYFYTRIFQIFGALALTLIDDATFMSERGLITDPKYASRLLAPGFGPKVIGGASREKDYGTFNFIKSYMENKTNNCSTDSDNGCKVKYKDNPIYFKILKSGLYEQKKHAQFSVGFRRRELFVLNISAKKDDDKINVRLDNIEYSKQKDSKIELRRFPITTEMVDQLQFTISITYVVNSIGNLVEKYNIRGETVENYFNKIFDKLIPNIKEIKYEGITIDDDYKYKYDDITGTKIRTVSETAIQPELRLTTLINKLTKERPLGYCLARAKQLLDNIPFQGADGISHICNPNFLKFDKMSKSSLPKSGDSLDVNPGLSSLANLFYDTVQYGTPKIIIGDNALPKYIQFMKAMAFLFNDPKKLDESKLSASKLSDIRDVRDGEICKGIYGDIKVPNKYSNNILSIVKELYTIQNNHAKNAGKIMTMLFDIQINKQTGLFQIQINPNILKNGILEINRINDLARNVLVEYYKSCEFTYMQGMKYVIDINNYLKTNPSMSPPVLPRTA